MSEPVLALGDVRKTYNAGAANAVEVLRGIDLTLAPGEIVALVAPSGAGKSTLLHIAGLLDTPDTGEVRLAGQSMGRASDDRRTRARRDDIGFIYQFHHLLPEFSALENVTLPQRAAGTPRPVAEGRARDLLGLVGLAQRADNRPGAMSGGEQQRVAFSRALANTPRLLLADEPTGNLDPATSTQVFDTLVKIVRDSDCAALIATHNHALAARMDRIVHLDQGQIVAP